MSFKVIRNDPDLVNFYTGLPNSDTYLWFLSLFKDEIKYICKTLILEDHLLLILMKLKLGLLNKDLAFRFKVTQQVISRIYRRWLPLIAETCKHLIVWPERSVLRKHIPSCFARKFKNCTCVIDCTEIFIERPFNLNARAQTWSNYKHTNTIKYLVGITPSGAVSFLSPGWGGRTTDKEITNKSGFLDKLQWGDCVMADRGFTIETELATKGAHLKIPKFTHGKKQMAARDIEYSRQIAHVRIHVERVIGRLRKFTILQSIIPVSQVDLLDDVMVIIAALVNVNNSVVS